MDFDKMRPFNKTLAKPEVEYFECDNMCSECGDDINYDSQVFVVEYAVKSEPWGREFEKSCICAKCFDGSKHTLLGY